MQLLREQRRIQDESNNLGTYMAFFWSLQRAYVTKYTLGGVMNSSALCDTRVLTLTVIGVDLH